MPYREPKAMQMPRLEDACRIKLVPLSVLWVIIIFSAATSFFYVGNFNYRYATADQTLKGADWISHPDGRDKARFRKEFVISRTVDQAVLMVSANDNFTVYLNGTTLGGEQYLGMRPTKTFDIHNTLKVGQNVLSVETTSGTSNQPAQMIVHLQYKTGSETHKIVSDRSWRVIGRFSPSSHEPPLRWYDPGYFVANWPNAVSDGSATGQLVIEPDIYPADLESVQTAEWFWESAVNEPFISVERDIVVPKPITNTLKLGIAINGRYQLYVNNHLVANKISHIKNVVLEDISKYVEQGQNTVVVNLLSSDHLPKAAIYGFIRHSDDSIENIGSKGAWHLSSGSNKLVAVNPPQLGLPTLTNNPTPAEPAYYHLHKIKYGLFLTALLFTVVFALGFMGTLRLDDNKVRDAWLNFVWPLIVFLLFLFLLWAIKLDPAIYLSMMTLYGLSTVGLIIATLYSIKMLQPFWANSHES